MPHRGISLIVTEFNSTQLLFGLDFLVVIGSFPTELMFMTRTLSTWNTWIRPPAEQVEAYTAQV